jgi:hypothetical protein
MHNKNGTSEVIHQNGMQAEPKFSTSDFTPSQFVTIKNPVALYIDSLDASTWTTPDGTDAQTFWTITRGKPGFSLRAVYQVPKEKGYVVGDIQKSPGQ